MTTFKVRECGNTPEQAFHRAKDEDGAYGTNSGIQECNVLLPSPVEREDLIDMVPTLQKTAYYLDLDGGEYLFYGTAQ
jgi:hypothetical protein